MKYIESINDITEEEFVRMISEEWEKSDSKSLGIATLNSGIHDFFLAKEAIGIDSTKVDETDIMCSGDIYKTVE